MLTFSSSDAYRFTATFRIYLLTKFHAPRCSGSLVTAMILKAKYRLRVATMLFYILKNCVNRSCMLFESLLPYSVSVSYIK